LAWSPDGLTLACGSFDGNVYLVEVTGRTLSALGGHKGGALCLSWSSANGLLASGAGDGGVRVWDTQTGRLWQRLDGHTEEVLSIHLSPDGRTIASGSCDKTISLWDVVTGRRKSVLKGHDGAVTAVAWSHTGVVLASGSGDYTVRLWGAETAGVLALLESHTKAVTNICFSPDDRLLATVSQGEKVCLWCCDSWLMLADFGLTAEGEGPAALNFGTTRSALAAADGRRGEIRTWEFQPEALLGPRPELRGVHYTNAKVVLVGESGVGKSGLALVLAYRRFESTDSTHGRRVWTMESEATVTARGDEIREIFLWDLAGQPAYRLIHPWELNNVSVALLVFDARGNIDPLPAIRQWNQALQQAQREQDIPIRKFLVATRADIGRIGLSAARVEAFVREMGFEGYFETSAKEGWGVAELAAAIRGAIDWEELPSLVSTELVSSVRRFLIEEKAGGRLLSTSDGLYRAFCDSNLAEKLEDESAARSEFEVCIGLVESWGLIRRLSFGNLVLLQPELLDGYAAAIINAAREEPDGMGAVSEKAVVEGCIPVPEGSRISNREEEKLLLISIVEDLLRREIALREVTAEDVYLVFPTQFTRGYPDWSDPTGAAITYTFDGAVLNIYATLAVRLAHSGLFMKKEMWKNAATFRARVGGTCGMRLRAPEEGRGEMVLFFDVEVSEETRFHFDEFVHAHLMRRAAPDSVTRQRLFSCPLCGTAVTASQVSRRQERGFDWITCNVCGERYSLTEADAASTPRPSAVQELDRAADARRKREAAAAVLRGKSATGDFDVFLNYNPVDRDAVRAVAHRLKKLGILPWLDEEQLRPGTPWQVHLEKQIDRIKSVAVFVGRRGIGTWQDLEQNAFIREFIRRGCPVIPVLLPEAPGVPTLPAYLSGFSWVDFRRQVPDPMQQLAWGITGERPSDEELKVLVHVDTNALRGVVTTQTGTLTEVSPETQARADLREIRLAVTDESYHDYARLAEAVIRRMGATSHTSIKSPLFEEGTLWQMKLPRLGLQLSTRNSILFLRRSEDEEGSAYDALAEIAGESQATFVVVADTLELRSTPMLPGANYLIHLSLDHLLEMASLPPDEVPRWLGRFITSQVDVKPLLPYKTKGPTELFFGRDYELARLLGEKLHGGILIGSHRSGKSSLLRRLGERLAKKGHKVVGPETVGGIEDFRTFFERMLDPLGINVPRDMSPGQWASAIRSYKHEGKCPVFLLDEVDDLIRLDETAGFTLGKQMRALQNDDKCEFYLAGHSSLRRAIAVEGGPLRNFAEEVVLTGLTKTASLRLIQEPIKHIGFAITEGQALRIFTGTAGVAVLIQEFCIRLLLGLHHLYVSEISDTAVEEVERSADYLGVVFEHYQYAQDYVSNSVMTLAAILGGATRKELTGEFLHRGVKLTWEQLDDALAFLVRFGVLEEFSPGRYRILPIYLSAAIKARDPEAFLQTNLAKVRDGSV
jgi:small GTP-binding protein